ncbi:MAG: hypothetical protein Q9160_004179 [Pyrenula sp. 1 TL-2023]
MGEYHNSGDPHVVVLPSYTCTGKGEDNVNGNRLDDRQDLEDVVQAFLNKLRFRPDQAGDSLDVHHYFIENCWLRDFLCFKWDFRTIHGIDAVRNYFHDCASSAFVTKLKCKRSGSLTPKIVDVAEGLQWLESLFDFETHVGHGSGVIRLVRDPHDSNRLKIFAISFMLQGLNNCEERVRSLRPPGTQDNQNVSNWLDTRNKEQAFVESAPTVLIIGAGQAGLNTAARLKQLGVPSLIIDRNERVGDNWRMRYKSLVTHDPVTFTHMAYLPFPESWPLFTPKDKLGDWLEHYASIQELNVWTRTTITSAKYDPLTRAWTVDILRDGTTPRTLKPRHIILCTGHSGEPYMPTFPGQETFYGSIYHGSQHTDASHIPSLSSKKALVVGTGNSGHDIAQNFYENGAKEVTMLQRRGTYVINATKGNLMQHASLYREDGPKTEDADIYAQSLPFPVQFALSTHFTKLLREDVEMEMNDGLEKAGFKIDAGPAGSGLVRTYYTKGGGYYLDVGCSQLIIDGKVKVRRCEEGIEKFVQDGLVLKDGQKIQADVVVLATGYDNMRTSVQKILGEKVASKCKDVWDLDEEGELRAMYRFSGHAGFWYMGGNLANCRIYSRLLALQIKALELGLYEQPPLRD